jgi:hypothetical protein
VNECAVILLCDKLEELIPYAHYPVEFLPPGYQETTLIVISEEKQLYCRLNCTSALCCIQCFLSPGRLIPLKQPSGQDYTGDAMKNSTDSNIISKTP